MKRLNALRTALRSNSGASLEAKHRILEAFPAIRESLPLEDEEKLQACEVLANRLPQAPRREQLMIVDTCLWLWPLISPLDSEDLRAAFAADYWRLLDKTARMGMATEATPRLLFEVLGQGNFAAADWLAAHAAFADPITFMLEQKWSGHRLVAPSRDITLSTKIVHWLDVHFKWPKLRPISVQDFLDRVSNYFQRNGSPEVAGWLVDRYGVTPEDITPDYAAAADEAMWAFLFENGLIARDGTRFLYAFMDVITSAAWREEESLKDVFYNFANDYERGADLDGPGSIYFTGRLRRFVEAGGYTQDIIPLLVDYVYKERRSSLPKDRAQLTNSIKEALFVSQRGAEPVAEEEAEPVAEEEEELAAEEEEELAAEEEEEPAAEEVEEEEAAPWE